MCELIALDVEFREGTKSTIASKELRLVPSTNDCMYARKHVVDWFLVMPLLDLAQRQVGAETNTQGWLPIPVIEFVARELAMPVIRVLEVASFYTMYNLAPVGRFHVQVCGTTPCMLRGAEDLKKVCRDRIHPEQHHISADGNFSWEEAECLGACVNAPMVLIWKDTYEDLNKENFGKVLDGFASGNPPKPGPQIDRQFSAPVGGPTTLKETT